MTDEQIISKARNELKRVGFGEVDERILFLEIPVSDSDYAGWFHFVTFKRVKAADQDIWEFEKLERI